MLVGGNCTHAFFLCNLKASKMGMLVCGCDVCDMETDTFSFQPTRVSLFQDCLETENDP